MTLVSGDIRFMRIFAEIPWGGESNEWGRQFSAFAVAISSETLDVRPALLHIYRHAVLRRLFSDPKMHDLK